MKQKLTIFIAVFLVVVFSYFTFTQLVKTTTAKVDVNNKTDSSSPIYYSLVEVATHNSESNCWTVVKGKVYDLTAMISTHPSGKSDILKICGIDGTNLFQREHGNKVKVIRQLNSGLIGNLK